MEILSFFPTAIGVFNFNRRFTQSELNCVNNLQRKPSGHNSSSVDSFVLNNNPELKEIKDFLLASCNQYLEEIYTPKEKLELYITQSWLNYAKFGERHHLHTHYNSIVSGVFYINASENIDKISFTKDTLVTKQLEITPRHLHQFNSEISWIYVQTGKLVLFPSTLRHSVPMIESKTERISLAFNTFVKGTLGSEESFTSLHL